MTSKNLSTVLNKANKNKHPTFISCRTKIGFGSPNKESTAASHGSPLGEEEVTLTRKKLNWSHKPFKIPNELIKKWRSFALKNKKEKY